MSGKKMAITTLFIINLLIVFSQCKDCFKPQMSVFAQFCSDKGERSVTGDFNGDGYDDLLCHNFRTGFLEIMYSSLNAFEKRYWSDSTSTWCKGIDNLLYAGDFNGDKKSDLVCHNTKTGGNQIAYANNKGNFYDYDCDWIDADGTGASEIHIGAYDPEECVQQCVKRSLKQKSGDPPINGATYKKTGSPACYCEKGMTGTSGSSTYRTCFIKRTKCSPYSDGDGSGGYDRSEGTLASDEACPIKCIEKRKTNPDINGAAVSTDGQHRCYCEYKMSGVSASSNWKTCALLSKRLSPTNKWCLSDQEFFIGDFNGDGKSDWLCHQSDGRKYLAYATKWGHIGMLASNWYGDIPRCDGELFVGNFNDDKKSDLMCYNYNTGKMDIALNVDNVFPGNTLTIDGRDWCTGTHVFIKVADINGDGLDDLICKDSLANGQAKVIKNQPPNYFDTSTTTYYSKFCINSKRSNFLTGPFTGDHKGDFMCLLDSGRIQVEKSHCQ